MSCWGALSKYLIYLLLTFVLIKMIRVTPLEEKTDAICICAGANFYEAEWIFNERFPDTSICRK